MSIYIMTVGELAKKRGEPVGEFVKKLQGLGFEAGSHAKRLTQNDLDTLIPKLEGTEGVQLTREERSKEIPPLNNPNVLLIKDERNSLVFLVDVEVKDDGEIAVKVVSKVKENSLGEALLEFRKLMGIHVGVH
jgi:hypothetical protein